MHAKHLWLVVAAAFILGLPRLPAQDVVKRLPTAALISSDDNVTISLFEARLLAGDEAKWLERNEIKRLLEEQKLDAIFGSAGGKERLALGKLMKADVLVMIRRMPSSQEKGLELLECIMNETKQGLRLQIAYAPSGNNPPPSLVRKADPRSRPVDRGEPIPEQHLLPLWANNAT